MKDINRNYSAQELINVAYMAAGAGSGAVMTLCPDVVMPTEDIVERVESILANVLKEDQIKMATATSNMSHLPVISVFIHPEVYDDYEGFKIPVGYDGYSIILHLPDGSAVSFDRKDILNLIENGAKIFYQGESIMDPISEELITNE